MAEIGYLLGCVVQGYTAFFIQSELDHAGAILHNLYQKLAEILPTPHLENDRLLWLLPPTLEATTLLDQVESLTYTFAHARDAMHLQTTCTCRACQQLPTLQLKTIVHRGDYLGATLGGRGGMLLRTMLDAHASSDDGRALFTEACGLGGFFSEMRATSESYEHFGDIQVYAYDLTEALARYQTNHRSAISSQDVTLWFTKEARLPVSAAQAWDYINLPHYQKLWRDSKEIVIDGRMGQGTVLHCIHTNMSVWGVIEDWRPFDYVTYNMHMRGLPGVLGTIWFQSTAQSTTLEWVFARPLVMNHWQRLAFGASAKFMEKRITQQIDQGLQQLQKIIGG